MAQWQTLTKLCQHDSRVQDRVIELYQRTNFPYKFRSRFANWIEQQDWSVVIGDSFLKLLFTLVPYSVLG